jgi:UDP-N-acetylmuramyl pentapeptide phosphotransferase/UDP-N-acetylglucosamine-1-phosphate transferase
MLLPNLLPSVYTALAVSFAVTLLLVITRRWHGRFSMDDTHGIQKQHRVPTPRIGGVAIVLGVLAAWAVAKPER